MLSKPILAKTDNRAILAPVNPYCGDPEMWFDSDCFLQQGLHATSFDFFVDWNNNTICDEVWIKRISDSNDIQNATARELRHLISTCDGPEKSNSMYCFFRAHNMTEKYMLFRDVPESEWANCRELIVELDMSCYQNDIVKYYNANDIQEKIRNLRKRAAPIGNAGLIYSTSSLEGYLSKQQYFWPGDVDTVLFDDNNNVIAVIEFKKHTKYSKIPFENQCLSNYLNRDILKYESLALLRDRFQTKLYVLYYPIPDNIDYVIIERIDGPYNSLCVGKRFELSLPNINFIEQLENFAENFINEL